MKKQYNTPFVIVTKVMHIANVCDGGTQGGKPGQGSNWNSPQRSLYI